MIAGDCPCGNAARYINERGELCCAICPLKEGIDSIKLADVHKLLAWARVWSRREPDYADPFVFREQAKQAIRELRDIVQRFPEPPPTTVAQLTNDATYLTYTPTAADGDIIGEPLAARLEASPSTPIAAWDTVVAVTESKP